MKKFLATLAALSFALPVFANTPDPPPVGEAFAPATVRTTRAPVGHTHTCYPCNETWDHMANAEHNCTVCGREVLAQDATPRRVTVYQSAPQATARQWIEIGGVFYPQTSPVLAPQFVPTYALPMSGCANGSCDTLPARPRAGLLNRLRR